MKKTRSSKHNRKSSKATKGTSCLTDEQSSRGTKNDSTQSRRRQHSHWHNSHHLLFPKSDWNQSRYAQKLRDHAYFRKIIPEDSLHKRIHGAVLRIPVPPEEACRKAYCEILRRSGNHLINKYDDTLERRLQVLIELWADYPATAKALREQQRIAILFYKNGRM